MKNALAVMMIIIGWIFSLRSASADDFQPKYLQTFSGDKVVYLS